MVLGPRRNNQSTLLRPEINRQGRVTRLPGSQHEFYHYYYWYYYYYYYDHRLPPLLLLILPLLLQQLEEEEQERNQQLQWHWRGTLTPYCPSVSAEALNP